MAFRNRGQQNGDATQVNLVRGPVDPAVVSRRRFVLLMSAITGVAIFSMGIATLVSVMNASGRANDALALARVSQIQSALHQYAVQFGQFPAGENIAIGEGVSCGGRACTVLVQSGFAADAGDATPIGTLPVDTRNSSFTYSQQNDQTSYRITVKLDVGTQTLPAGVYAVTPSGIASVQ